MKKVEETPLDIVMIDSQIREFLISDPLHFKLTDPNPLKTKERFENIQRAEDVLELLQKNNIDLQDHSLFYSDILDIVYKLELEIVQEKSRLNILRTLKYTEMTGEINRVMAQYLFDYCVFHYNPKTRHTRKTNFHELYYFCTLQPGLDMESIWIQMEMLMRSSIIRHNIEDIKTDIFTQARMFTINNIVND